MKKAVLIVMLFLPVFASASFYPTSYNWSGATTSEQYSYGFSAGSTEYGVVHIATTTLASINSVSLNLCNYNSATGNFYMVVWYNGTTSPYTSVATSSVLSASDLVTCIPTGTTYLASTTQFTFGNTFNASSGDTLYFRIFPTISGGGSVIVQGTQYLTSEGIFPGDFYAGSNGAYPSIYNSSYYSFPFTKIGSGLPAYSTSWADIVQSAKESQCDNFVTCAFAWAFYASPESLQELKEINIASTSPFGYVYDLKNKFSTFATSGTSSASISVPLGNLLGSLTASGTTTTIPILSSTGIKNVLGTSTWNLIQTLLTYMLWIGFGFYAYQRGLSLV